MGEVSVELGFVEKREAQWLTNRYFPSKVGGKPAWLDLCSLPTAKDLACLLCKKPMILICQVNSIEIIYLYSLTTIIYFYRFMPHLKMNLTSIAWYTCSAVEK